MSQYEEMYLRRLKCELRERVGRVTGGNGNCSYIFYFVLINYSSTQILDCCRHLLLTSYYIYYYIFIYSVISYRAYRYFIYNLTYLYTHII